MTVSKVCALPIMWTMVGLKLNQKRSSFSWPAVDGLHDQGAIIQEVDLKLGLTGNQIRLAITQARLFGAFGGRTKELMTHADALTTYARYFAKIAATGMGPDEALQAANTIERLTIVVEQSMFANGDSALISPTLNISRLAANPDPTSASPQINAKAVDPHAGRFQTPLWTPLNW